MDTFLEETISKLLTKHEDVSSLIIILPSKRSGGFFKNYLRKKVSKTTFLPQIISIEAFVETLADLKIIDNTELLLMSYQAYCETTSVLEKEAFESYSFWIQTLLNDFNELDRYLIDTEAFFNHLGNIKSMEKWTTEKGEQTELIKNYLSFWESLPEFYENLKHLLLRKGLGYQGMVYRKASEEIEHYITTHGNKPHIFIGFNALNKAEQNIIKEFLETGNSEIHWDADRHFFNEKDHSAASFMNSYFETWKYYGENQPVLDSNFEKPKTFQFIETQKNISQAKYVGQLLSGFSEEQLNSTAVVLADENLLVPLLYSLPENITSVNITMGIPLKHFPSTLFLMSLINMHQKKSGSFYYKDVFTVLNHPLATLLIPEARNIVQHISSQNQTYVPLNALVELTVDDKKDIITLLFGDWKNNGAVALKNLLELLLKLRVLTLNNTMEKVQIFTLYSIVKKIENQQASFPYIESIKAVQSLLQESLATATIDYKGDAYNGLQIMGVLETRVLDFENVILTSVNEGLLPSGKSNASFITYDLKTVFGLPLYTDKDAIYTYHFYRLLHRASNIWLLYNNHSEGLNAGEKSRFLLQLEIEKLPNHTISKHVISPKLAIDDIRLQTIVKTPAVMERIKEIAAKGFSPSALTAYIRNPLDFYFERVLKIKQAEIIEETVEYSTLGIIVHNTLQKFYEPLEGVLLSKSILTDMKGRIHEEVTLQFQDTFRKGTFTKGKNLLIFEVVKRYVENLINLDISEINKGNTIEIIQIEHHLKIPVEIPESTYPIHLLGTVDRVDKYNGELRIIDYKTGNVKQGDVEIIDWADITTDYKYSKAFQVLAYALMINYESAIDNATAGIISFKNMNNGFLKFGTKASSHGQREQQISKETLDCFKSELHQLILEICNPEIPFTEKEV